MTGIFLHIVNMSITASVLAVIVLLLRLLLKKAPKWISVLLWGLVAIRLICPFAVESPFSLMPKTDWVEEASVPVDDLYLSSIPDSIPVIDSSSLGKDVTVHYHPNEPEIEIHKSVSMPFILSCIWLGGIAVLLLHALISTIRLRRSVGAAIWVKNNIWESSAVDSPFVLGLFSPRIYIPRGMTEENLAYVIAHEEAHIRRHDHWWKPLGFLLLSLHWFNPVMWLAYILLCRDIEMACDERVVKEYSEVQRADYSEALLECSVKRSMISACPLAFGEVGVKQRIKSVLNYKKPAFWIVAVAVVACIVAAVCFLTNPGSFHSFGRAGAGLRFPTTNPHAAEWCDISISGQIIRDEFKGTFSVDGRQMEVSIFMDSDTPTVGYYVGSRREIFGILLVFDDKLSRFALKTKETNEYILYGMTVEEFEWEMKHRNYYVDYQHDVVLHDITASDKSQIISDIHTEGRTVIIYGKDLDTEEINRTFYSEDDVMGTLEYLPSEDIRVFYACASTCLNGKVYVGYYSINYPADGDKADLMALLENEYLTESTLMNIGYDFRNKKLETHGPETDPFVFETAPLPEEKIPLTLDDVIRLSKKGEALTWEDFAEFKSIETGSGLYIRVYEIDENFELWIGGGAPIGTPMYIYLTLADDIDTRIDIRDGDVAEFIYQHKYTEHVPSDTDTIPNENDFISSDLSMSMYDLPLHWFIDMAWNEAVSIAASENLAIDKNNFSIRHNSDGKTIWIQFFSTDKASQGEEFVEITIMRDDSGTFTVQNDAGRLSGSSERIDGTKSPLTAERIAENDRIGSEFHEFIADESEFTVRILFRTDEPITDIQLTTLDYTEDGFNRGAPLYSLEKMTPDKPLVIGVVFYGDLTTYSFSFTDAAGTEHQYMIYESGKDGSVIIQAY